ncbi:MAG: hypothetical protein PHQ86_07345 [Dehalococcoidales bacterium]|nr:hypothetical protein [Dehalococcoidales bacterium]
MAKRKYPEKVTVIWSFNDNPNPTKLEIEENERAIKEILDNLFRPPPEAQNTIRASRYDNIRL